MYAYIIIFVWSLHCEFDISRTYLHVLNINLVLGLEAMVPRSRFHIILFLLSLLYFTCRSEMQADFDQWISWNVKTYKKETILETKWKITGPGQALDLKLKQAESNKVIIKVSQDGAGDFKTITEAINSIPPPNTRRVLVLISPGVYR